MRIKTIFIIIVTVLLTVVLMQNSDAVPIKFLFARFQISMLLVLLIVAVIGFIVGLVVGRPGKPKYIPGQVDDDINKNKPNTLSDEDRDYIS